MWLSKSIRNWKRKDFDPPLNNATQIRRNKAEKEADHDLQKPVQQFLCDVHEEADRPPCEKSANAQLTYAEDRILDAIDKLSCENKRMVALQTVTAFATNKTAQLLTRLTVILVVLTFLLIALEFLHRPYTSFYPSGLHWKTTREQKVKEAHDTNNKTGEENQNLTQMD